jgi:hypothetical protein
MPLTKRAPETTAPTAMAGTQSITTAAQNVAPGTTTQAAAMPPPAKRIGGTRKAGDKAEAPMTKDDYWRNREERDIEKDQRISRQGMFQAALQSTGVLQLNTGNTLEDYLKLVEQTAERGLQFAHKA